MLHRRSWIEAAEYKDEDFDALLNFLSPNGKLFKCILRFHKDSSISYIFPSPRLPFYTQNLLNAGDFAALPSLYKSKLKLPQRTLILSILTILTIANTGMSSLTSKDIFDYFFFCYACYAVSTSRSAFSNDQVFLFINHCTQCIHSLCYRRAHNRAAVVSGGICTQHC